MLETCNFETPFAIKQAVRRAETVVADFKLFVRLIKESHNLAGDVASKPPVQFTGVLYDVWKRAVRQMIHNLDDLKLLMIGLPIRLILHIGQIVSVNAMNVLDVREVFELRQNKLLLQTSFEVVSRALAFSQVLPALILRHVVPVRLLAKHNTQLNFAIIELRAVFGRF